MIPSTDWPIGPLVTYLHLNPMEENGLIQYSWSLFTTDSDLFLNRKNFMVYFDFTLFFFSSYFPLFLTLHFHHLSLFLLLFFLPSFPFHLHLSLDPHQLPLLCEVPARQRSHLPKLHLDLMRRQFIRLFDWKCHLLSQDFSGQHCHGHRDNLVILQRYIQTDRDRCNQSFVCSKADQFYFSLVLPLTNLSVCSAACLSNSA